jgi:transglutaminase-like putative cysteine protease
MSPSTVLCTLIFTLCLLAFSSKTTGQASDVWQAIPQEDLALKDNPADPGCSAMILERQVFTDDEKRVQTEWVRIKVFTEAGKENADIQVPYFEKKTSVENIRGRTVRPDGTVIPFSGAVFNKVVIRYKKFRYNVKAFTLPGVEVGSIIDYSFAVRWKEQFPDVVRHPEMYSIRDGWTFPTTTWTIEQELFTRHAVFSIRPVKGGHLTYARVRLSDNFPSSQPDGTMRMEVKNVPAIDHEEFMPPESMLNRRVHLYYTVGPIGNYWSTVSEYSARNADKFVEKSHFLEQATRQIAPATDPPQVRLKKLYARVQQVRYLSYDRDADSLTVSQNKSADDVLRHNYGYGNEINFLFVALARSAGFDASFMMVVNRASAVFEPQVLDESQLTAGIVVVRLNGENIYFDPATRFCPYGMIPWYENDTSGLRWDKAGGDLLQVQSDASKLSTVERRAELNVKPDGALEGSLEIVYTGQDALDLRLSAYEEDDAGRSKIAEDQVKELTPAGVTVDIDSVDGWQDSEQPLRIKCHLHAYRFASFTPNRMLFPIAVFQLYENNPYNKTYRVNPVYLQYGYVRRDQLTISMPSGYQLEAMPPDTEENTAFASFHLKHTSDGVLLKLERQREMNGYFFPARYYSSLREFTEKVRQRDAENVVLHKTEPQRP